MRRKFRQLLDAVAFCDSIRSVEFSAYHRETRLLDLTNF